MSPKVTAGRRLTGVAVQTPYGDVASRKGSGQSSKWRLESGTCWLVAVKGIVSSEETCRIDDFELMKGQRADYNEKSSSSSLSPLERYWILQRAGLSKDEIKANERENEALRLSIRQSEATATLEVSVS